MLSLRRMFGASSPNVFSVVSLRHELFQEYRYKFTTQNPRHLNQKASTKISKTSIDGLIVKQDCSVESTLSPLKQSRSTNVDLDHISLLEKVKRLSGFVEANSKRLHCSNPLTSSCDIIGSRHDVIELLLKTRVPDNQITDYLPKATMSLATAPLKDWEETIEYLKGYQFHPVQILPVLSTCPDLMVAKGGIGRKSLCDILTLLRSMGFGEGKMQAIISKNPAILTVPIILVHRNHENLLQVFTRAEVGTIVLANPIVLTTPWEETQAKLEYVFERMGAPTKEILKSQLFKHSLLHIATRHQFLERAGLYTKPHKRNTSTLENAELRSIIDSTEKAFVTLVAGLKEVDFKSFAETFKMEMTADEDSDELTDSDLDEFDSDGDTDAEAEKQ